MMAPWLFAVICGPLCFTATIFNIFFSFCLMRPADGVSLRSPMRFLLIAVLCNSTLQQIVTALIIIIAFFQPPHWLHTISRVLVYETFCGNFSCNAWISIFYYMSIIPQQHGILVWIKRNIIVIIYVGFILNQVLLLISLSMGTVSFLMIDHMMVNSTSYNLTTTSAVEKGLLLFKMSNFLFVVYCTCPLITLTISWSKTFVYLRGHIKKMGQNESFSHSQQKSQMRVTVIGMIQAALFLPSSLWTVTAAFLYILNLFETVDPSRFITVAFCSASSLGNILCFGFSQSVFRLRIISLFRKAKEDS